MTMATIESKVKWNDTGIDLIEGQKYTYGTTGEWQDWYMKPCSSEGYSDVCLDLLSWTKRNRHAKWFQLIGVVNQNTKNPLYTICFGKSGTFTAHASGRLWAFANDAWIAYGNNSGLIELNIF